MRDLLRFQTGVGARLWIAVSLMTTLPPVTRSVPAIAGEAAVQQIMSSEPAIKPMTTIGSDGSEYFSDPYPVRLAPGGSARQLVFTGTTQAVMACTYPISPGCFSWTPTTISVGKLGARIAAAGATFTNFQNLNALQDDNGLWHAVLAIGVKSAAHPSHWTVLVHAHAASAPAPGATPISWAADTVLSGSFSDPVEGNYDGKYYLEDGHLYLLYVKNFVPEPTLRNGIVLQPMISPTQAVAVSPTTLLTTSDRFGALQSENYGSTQAKLVEAPYLVRIAGRFALIYSTGAYQQVDYKVGVAWSDTLLPAPGGRYRKVLQMDMQGVWGQAGAKEVHYLVQSQYSTWPNFTGDKVMSPGVASMTQSPQGVWRLFFAGFDPADRPLISPGVAEASHRRPYYLCVRVAVPPGQTISSASDAELATWITPFPR